MSEGAAAQETDVIVIGSGAGGLAAAVTAAQRGLKVLVLEKDTVYGGTTARSGGVLWIPANGINGPRSDADVRAAREYLVRECGEALFDAGRVDAFLANGPRMVDFFSSQTSVQFAPLPAYPDYHPDEPGAVPGGRSIMAAPFDARELGPRMKALRPPLKEITFVGMMFNSSQEIQHFFKVTRSLRSAVYVARRLMAHGTEMLRYRRATRLTNGNALAARLAKSAFDLGAELWLDAPALRLVTQGDGRVTGVVARHPETKADVHIRARRGVVLACGGFPQDVARRRALFSHAPTGAEHHSPAPATNTGDGISMGIAAGGVFEDSLPNPAAWIPVSLVPRGKAPHGVFPHLIDRYKPGVIAVNPAGRRFVNESNSYHDVGIAMRREAGHAAAVAWLVCDHTALRRYGLGHVKPFPLPLWPQLRSGYLLRGATLEALARRIGIDPAALQQTVAEYNRHAEQGEDPAFGRGSTAYNRYLGDHDHAPNPCVAPITRAPFYALRVTVGDLGTFAGLRTNERAQVIDARGAPVPGLYAAGNDSLSVMGGNYPGAGITLGPAMTFGFIAGEQLAALQMQPTETAHAG
ncbi:FAD-dependent oxidoreductase [Xenophilus arseniciresistens]|uniref:FAD-dependent oxidoreductase n=1 Tax=Xenophilus arseniciresistens TaxID=1283306 RepID=A0AAE3NF79_9BURK|nr:FAD-dependent oxidoreductase [Xenophilus arseniciresistens]MDA7419187.1 FAD-dependent oxidoreductase [Xenophilus arseniciresistens]